MTPPGHSGLYRIVLPCIVLRLSLLFSAFRCHSSLLSQVGYNRTEKERRGMYNVMHECVNTEFAKKGNETVADCCIKAAQVCAYCNSMCL